MGGWQRGGRTTRFLWRWRGRATTRVAPTGAGWGKEGWVPTCMREDKQGRGWILPTVFMGVG